jgi:hypothetical protein
VCARAAWTTTSGGEVTLIESSSKRRRYGTRLNASDFAAWITFFNGRDQIARLSGHLSTNVTRRPERPRGPQAQTELKSSLAVRSWIPAADVRISEEMEGPPAHYPRKPFAFLIMGAVGLALIAVGVTGHTGWALIIPGFLASPTFQPPTPFSHLR